MLSKLVKSAVIMATLHVAASHAATLDELLNVSDVSPKYYDSAIQDIKARRFDQLRLGTKIIPENAVYSAATGAIAPAPASEPTALAPKVEAAISPQAAPIVEPIAPATSPPPNPVVIAAKPEPVKANQLLLSSLNEQQFEAVRAQAAQRVKRTLIYQPHNLAPEFSVIPAGRFRMGDIQGEGDFDEVPVRELVMSKAFGMSTTEVTFDIWQQCVDAGECNDVLHKQRGGDQGWGKGQRPVINISWAEVQTQFIPWFNSTTGEHFRLPTEAEWEYAARAGSDAAYSFGDKINRDYANFGKDKCCGGAKKGRDKWEFTAPVASFSPNKFGLYDMHGNVYEWVADCYSSNYESSPTQECSSGKRVARGGSWYDAGASLRSANRVKFSEGFRIIYLGFRLVHVVE